MPISQLLLLGHYKKSKDNLLSQTLKVVIKKVSLVFFFRPGGRDMTISSFDARL